MPSFADSIFIFVLALMLFGPKKLPQLAKQIGKLMAEFRRASNEFRMQMEDEMRIEEQKEHQAKVDAMAGPPSEITAPEHPHLDSGADTIPPVAESGEAAYAELDPSGPALGDPPAAAETAYPHEPLPIAESGSLKMMPPSTGLPVETRVGRLHDDFPSMHGSVPHEAVPAGIPVEEHSILPPASGAGSSSEEPAAEMRREGVNA